MPSQSETTKTMESASLACAACGQTNARERRFCGSCGARMWEPCVACGQTNGVDLQFCGSCGVDLEDAVEAEARILRSAVEEADKLAEAGRFLDALERLRTCSLPDHSGLRDVVSEINTRGADFPSQREQAIADARAAHRDALAFVDQRDDRRALARLNQIRPAFRSAEIRELMGQVESRIVEAKQLKHEIQTAVANKAYDGLLPKVTRLLQLEPPSDKLQKLGDQLRLREEKVDHASAARLLEEADQALAACDYRKAAAALAKYPDAVLDKEFARRRREALERVWLAAQLRKAPYVSGTLVEIGRRMTKLQPHDKRAAELSSELSRRWTRAVGKTGRVPEVGPTWVEPPGKTVLGSPVNFACVPKCLAEYAARESVAREPVAHDAVAPRKFLVAFGLALQGLGRAAIAFHLTPREQTSWLDKVARLKLTGSPSPTTAWGLDFGSESLKAIRLSIAQPDKKSSGKVQLDAAVEIALAKSTQPTDPPLGHDAPRKESDAFEQLRSKMEIADGTTLVLGLPSVQSPVRLFKLPDAKPDRFAEAVHYEVRGSVPLGEDELLYGSHRAKKYSDGGEGPVALCPAVAVAASRTHVVDRLKYLGSAASKITLVQSNCVALVNAYRYAVAESNETSERHVAALIDVGAETTSVVVDEGDLFWFRASYGGLAPLDNALAEELQLTRVQAAALRTRPEAAREMHSVDNIVQTGFESLVQSIQRAFDQYQRERGRAVEQVCLCGGGAYQFGLLRHLWFGGA